MGQAGGAPLLELVRDRHVPHEAATPEGVYAKAGWIGMSDWLGSGRYFRGNWRPIKKARAFVRSLGLRSQAEWTLDIPLFVAAGRNNAPIAFPKGMRGILVFRL
jgi:hypothetical protein